MEDTEKFGCTKEKPGLYQASEVRAQTGLYLLFRRTQKPAHPNTKALGTRESTSIVSTDAR